MDFYVCNIFCSLFAVFVYASFRFGVNSYLRVKKNSKSFINKNKRGYANYWLYKKIHSEIGLGLLYPLNIALIVLTSLYAIGAVGFGWSEALSLPIALCNLLLCLLQIPAVIFSEIAWNLEHYKKKYVVLEKNRSGGGFHSSAYAVVEICGLAAFAIYNISLAV